MQIIMKFLGHGGTPHGGSPHVYGVVGTAGQGR